MTARSDNRLRMLMLVALTVSCVDLWLKDTLPTPDWAFHHRSVTWVLGSWLLLIAVMPLARIPSTAVTVGAGFFSGGVMGNLISAGTDHLFVPNPLLFQTGGTGLAFNLADAAILVGNATLMVGLCRLVIKHRERLPRLRARVINQRRFAGSEAEQEARRQ